MNEEKNSQRSVVTIRLGKNDEVRSFDKYDLMGVVVTDRIPNIIIYHIIHNTNNYYKSTTESETKHFNHLIWPGNATFGVNTAAGDLCEAILGIMSQTITMTNWIQEIFQKYIYLTIPMVWA